MNGLWMGRYLRRWNRNTLVPRQPLTNDGPSGAIAAALATPPRLSATPLLSPDFLSSTLLAALLPRRRVSR